MEFFKALLDGSVAGASGGGGGSTAPLYMHNITFKGYGNTGSTTTTYACGVSAVISKSAEPMTLTKFAAFLFNSGLKTNVKMAICSGTMLGNGVFYNNVGVYSGNGGALCVFGTKSDSKEHGAVVFNDITSFVDTVVQIS